MAERIEVHLEDDLDGTKASETIEYTFEGVSYRIDLSDKNAKAFRKHMEKYINASRRETAAKRAKAPSARRSSNGGPVISEAARIRAWAKQHGIDVPPTGRVPNEVKEQYAAAN